MSKETFETLNRFVLIGNCANRPKAWHNRPEIRAAKGWENNHYDDFIPMKDVIRRLFDWEPIATPKANLVPCDKKDANFFGPKGEPFRVMPTGQWNSSGTYYGEKGIIRSDTLGHMATHGDSYRIHDYKEWLLKLQAKVIGKDLKILGAGLLRNGLQAYVQIALPEVVHDNSTGIEFLPYMMAATSLDGSMPTTFSRQGLYVVCDNTRDEALRQSARSGMIFTAKHTSRSLDFERINALRNSLSLLAQTAEEMVAENRELSQITVTPKNFVKWLDIIEPLPTEETATPTKLKRAENRREALTYTYKADPMCAQWAGTALGVIHAANTYWHHYRQVNAGDRFSVNMAHAIKGTVNDFDRQSVSALAKVLNRPDLVGAQ